jgi:hypothetical protein
MINKDALQKQIDISIHNLKQDLLQIRDIQGESMYYLETQRTLDDLEYRMSYMLRV